MSVAHWAAMLIICLSAVSAQAERPVLEAYRLHCSGCHGSDGSGEAGIVPSLRKLGPLLDVEGGRDYLVRVPGVAQAPLDNVELAALLNFVLKEMAGVNSFIPFSEGEIESLRRFPLRDPAAVRPIEH
jgi:mono/diheme cytochrome c family protein